jgi:hypothetical protein
MQCGERDSRPPALPAKDMTHRLWRTLEGCLVFTVLSLCVVRTAAADNIVLAWDAETSQVAGYIVHIGTQSGSYTQHLDVGLAISYTYPNAVAGQKYCFAVSAYSSGALEGPKSNEACGYSNAPPTLQNPGNQSSTVGQAVSLQLAGSDSQPLTYSATGLPPGVSVMASTGFISGSGTTAGSYSVTAKASDGVLSASQSFMWTMTTAAVLDKTPPTVTITGPTTASTYSAGVATLSLRGTAADNVNVSQVTWVNDRGGSGVATGTTNWSVPSITLASGTNTITVQARDAAGNLGNDVLSVTLAATAPSSDTTPPSVAITSPTTNASFSSTSSSVTLSGTSADNVGVAQVTWINNRGGSGVANGTTNWSTAAIPLKGGTNVITITARDTGGNVSTDVLTITRRQGR